MCQIKIFGYGTINDKRIQKILFGRELDSLPARLFDWQTYVCSEGYLGITKARGSYVDGFVLNLSINDLKICDLWEEVPLYKKITLTVIKLENAKSEDVIVYTRQIEGELENHKTGILLDNDYVIQEANLFMKKLKASLLDK